MSAKVDNNAYELVITPNKRKREYPGEGKELLAAKVSSFAAYNNNGINKHSENKENNFVYQNFMEVKSIAEIMAQRKNMSVEQNVVENPYEVIRKPPKKKTKHDMDDGCFENPALNINGPDKNFNPFEVKRTPIVAQDSHCFVNSGLNIRGAEREVRNPFEISREQAPPRELEGIENPGLEMQPTLAIGVPFTPTVGCRIDFGDIPLEALTPCSMLTRKLVFSPITKVQETTPKRRELSIISEEAVDISKELECYQLELENSMNEAKLTKNRGNKNLMDIKRKSTFAKRLAEQSIEDEPPKDSNDDSITSEIIKQTEHSCEDHGETGNECPRSSTPKTPKEQCIAKFPMDKSINDNPDVVYEEVEETQIEIKVEEREEEEFKNPAPFVRTYRRDIKRAVRKVEPKNSEDVPEKETHKDHEMFGNFRSSIRKSIRKLMHNTNKSKSAEDIAVKEPAPSHHGNLLNSIRQSLRRKKPTSVVPAESVHEVSIIDYKDRAVYKDTVQSKEKHMFAMAREEDGSDRHFSTKTTTIRSSFRKSSRHVMKAVFKKNVEDYSLEK